MVEAPCKDCDFRSKKCHSKCPSYNTFKQQWGKRNELINKHKNAERNILSYEINKAQRLK